MAAIPVAALAPLRNRDGKVQKLGSSSEIQGVPTAIATRRTQFALTIVLAAFLTILMLYYMWSIHRAQREVGAVGAL